MSFFPFLIFATFGSCFSAPVTYDQRQSGDLNVHAQLENLKVVVIGFDIGSRLTSLTEIIPMKYPFRSAPAPAPVAPVKIEENLAKDYELQRDPNFPQIKHVPNTPNFPVFEFEEVTPSKEFESAPTGKPSAQLQQAIAAANTDVMEKVTDKESSASLLAHSPKIALVQSRRIVKT